MGCVNPIKFTITYITFKSLFPRRTTTSLQLIWLSLEAVHLVWSNFWSFNFPLFKGYICALEISYQMLLLPPASAGVPPNQGWCFNAEKKSIKYSKNYFFSPTFAFIKMNVTKRKVRSNKYGGQDRLQLNYGHACFSHNRAFNYFFINYTVYTIVA